MWSQTSLPKGGSGVSQTEDEVRVEQRTERETGKRIYTVGFEDGGWDHDPRKNLEGKETNSPLEPLEGIRPANTLRVTLDFWPQRV